MSAGDAPPTEWTGLERSVHEAAGAVFGTVRGREVPRHYGDPASEYRAAVERVAVVDRSDRARLLVTGRAPVRMLDGILTGAIPAGPVEAGGGARSGRATYSAVLTAKGRMVTDLRVLRLDAGSGGGTRGEGGEAGAGRSPFAGPTAVPSGSGGERLLLDVPPEGVQALRAHFGRFLPPRFATVDDVSESTGLLTVLGPGAPALISREALGLRVEAPDLSSLDEGEYRVVDAGGRDTVHAVGNHDVAAPAWDLLADRATLRALMQRLLETGARAAGRGVWETLRVERGRPAWGADMDEETIPVEAGIHDRAIDYGKGCYTGQEVIVRIRDRGRVNRHLRGLRLGDVPSPAPGTELFAPDVRGERPAGVVTSAVRSPRREETLALAYVRREVEPGGPVRLGAVEGSEARVVALEDADWWPGQGS